MKKFKSFGINHIFYRLFFQLATLKQTVVLLKHDKEYMSKLLNEQQIKSAGASERIDQLEQQLVKTKQAREELYEKYIISR